jgi:hypothetical protein
MNSPLWALYRHRGTPNEADLDAELDAYTKNTEVK